MADPVDVKALLLQVDASVELMRRNLLSGEKLVDAFTGNVQRSLDAADRRFERFGRPLTQIGATVARTNAQIATLGGGMERVEQRIAASSGRIRAALLASTAGVAAAFSADRLKSLADGYTRFTNELRVAGVSSSDLAKRQEQLYEIAQKYGAPLEAIGTLYGRAAQAGRALGASQADLLKFTDAVGAGLKVQGGDIEAARGALLQLGQALGTGTVRAEEFNSVNEGLRPILQAAADASDKYKGSVAALRNDVLAGKITSQEFFRLVLAGYDSLQAKASTATLTIAASFTVLNNALGKYIGETDESLGATQRVSAAIVGVANNLDTIVPALAAITVAFGARGLGGAAVSFGASAIAAFQGVQPPMAAATLTAEQYAAAVAQGTVVLLGSKTAAAQKAQAVTAGAAAEVAAIEAEMAIRAEDIALLEMQVTLARQARVEAQAAQQAAVAAQSAGFGRLGQGGITVQGRKDVTAGALREELTVRRALTTVQQEQAVAEASLTAAKEREVIASQAQAVAQAEATLAARAGALASRALSAAYTLIGGPIGIAAIAIGALVAVVLHYREEAAEAERRTKEFADSGRQLNEHLTELAGDLARAAGGMRQIATDTATATVGMKTFAGQVGEAAQKLYELAKQRRHEQVLGFLSDKATADRDAAAALGRIASRRNAEGRGIGLGVGGITAQQDAADQKIYRESLERSRIAQDAATKAANIPLEQRLSASERTGGRDVIGDLARAQGDLRIAQAGGNKSEVNRLQAQVYELTQYQAYRKRGFSDESAKAQAAADADRLKSAGESRIAAQQSAKANRESAASARRQASAERDSAQDARAFSAAERQANDAIANARAELSGSAEERDQIEKDRIEAEHRARNDEIADAGRAGRFGNATETKVRVARLQALSDEQASLETQVVEAHKQDRIAAETTASQLAALDTQGDILNAQGALATTAAERRRIELRLLDIQQEEERIRLEAIIAARTSTDAEKQAARDRLAANGRIYHLRRADVENRNLAPGDRYRKDIADAANGINEGIEQIQVNGLQSLNNELADAILGAKSLGAAFKNVANQIIGDLLRIAIQQAVIKPLATALFGGIGFADGGKVKVPGFAGGGLLSGAGTGRSDSMVARVSNGEFIVNAAATRAHLPLLDAINRGKLRAFADGGLVTPRAPIVSPTVPSSSLMRRAVPTAPTQVIVHVEANDYFDAKVASIATPIGQAAAIGGANLASKRQARAISRRLGR